MLNNLKRNYREQETLYRGLFENAGTAMCLIDEHLLIQTVNSSFEQLVGLPRRKIEKKLTWMYFIPEGDRGRIGDYHSADADDAGPQGSRYEVQIVDKAGNIRDILVSITSLKGTTRNILSIIEVTQNRRIQKALAYRLSFEQVSSAISGGFVNITPGRLHEEINKALERIGRFAKSDRCFIFFIDPPQPIAHHDYQWCAPGVTPLSGEVPENLAEKLPWTLDIITANGRLNVPDTRELPEAAAVEKNIFLSEGVKSAAVVPMIHANTVKGLLGFDTVEVRRFWTDDDFFLLETVAEIIIKAVIHEVSRSKLAENEQRFRKIFQQGPLAMALVDTQFCVTAVNPRLCALTGYGEEELKGRRLNEFSCNEGLRRSRQAEQRLLDGGIPYFSMEARLTRKNGEFLWVYWTTFSIRNEKHEPVYSVELLEDITERKKAVEALRKSEQKYRDFADFLPQVVFEADMEGRLTYANRYAFELFQYNREDFLKGLTVYEMLHPAEADRVSKNIGSLFDGARTKGEEYDAMRKNGELFPVLIYSVAIWEKGTPAGFRGIIIDISARKDLEYKLVQSQKMEAIGRLAGGIAHDFNNILTVILGHGSLLVEKEELPLEIREELTDIINAARSGAALTRQLLAFSRKQIMQMEVLDLNNLINSSQKMLRRLINEGITFTVELDPNLRKIRADSGQIEQIIMNLVINASDAMPKGGFLTVRTSMTEMDEETARKYGNGVPGPYAVLEVADTGRGMDEQTREKIMEPFFTTKKAHESTGLGLSTVYGIVKQLGGVLTVSSRIDRGSTFSVFMPPTDEPARETCDDTVSYTTGNEVILLVEDEKELRAVAGRMLGSAGYSVLEAADGRQALGILENNSNVDLIITDIVMPEMNGRELAEEIERAYPGKKILFMSGYTDDLIIQHGVSEQRMNFLHKPFTKSELNTKGRGLLDRTSMDDCTGARYE